MIFCDLWKALADLRQTSDGHWQGLGGGNGRLSQLSNHKLAIETGRYSRLFKKPAERTCPICKIEMEDEYHFLNICPAYQEKRCSLLDYLEKEYRITISRMSPNRIFMFLINPPSRNVRMQKLIAKHIFECFGERKGEDGKSKYSRT